MSMDAVLLFLFGAFFGGSVVFLLNEWRSEDEYVGLLFPPKFLVPYKEEIMTRGFEVVSNAPCEVKLPERKTRGAAGYDFYAPEEFEVKPGETVLVKTWVKAFMPENEYLKIYARSSWGVKRKMDFCYSGIIDSDYYNNPRDEGNITLAIHNFGSETQKVEVGERICQGIFMKYEKVGDDNATKTREGGFGSTGR